VTVHLDHIIVHASSAEASAHFLADLVGLPAQPRWGPFVPVALGNGVTLDYLDTDLPITEQHCAFLVDDATFDTAYARLLGQGARTWADPERQQPGKINRRFDGRGVYFDDPDGHLFELMTTRYAATPTGEPSSPLHEVTP
jgi:catechol 2,3-dioxygenase-like lactoylglutathione lyase family enzyme